MATLYFEKKNLKINPMKKILLFQLIILLFACNQSNEKNPKSNSSKETKLESEIEKESVKNEEEIISDIRQKFKEINQNTASYQAKNIELMGESTEGGKLTSYYQNKALKKVVVSYFGEMGKSIEEYYFSENNVFFVFTQEYSYDKPIHVKDSRVVKVEEDRYYFHNSKLVRWLDPNQEKIAQSKFKQKESAIFQKIKELKQKLENSKMGDLNAPKKNDNHIDIESLFSLSPLSVFDQTTNGLNLSEKNDLLKKGESHSWKIMNRSKTKLAIQSKPPSSEVTLYFLKNKNNLDGLFFAETGNGKSSSMHSWKYFNESKTLQKTNLLKKFNANDFVSKDDQLPDSYEAGLNYHFIDDLTIEVSLHTWMEKEFENREIINQIFLKWNGEDFEEKIEKINK